MFDGLSDRLDGILGRLRSRGRLSDADVDQTLREIRTALLEADVDVAVTRSFVEGTRARLVGDALSRSLSPAQQVIKAVHDELVRVLGGETLRVSYASAPPTVVLLAGLQGSGKTTTAAKLARWFRQQGRNPLMVGADLQRPRRSSSSECSGGKPVSRCSARPPIPCRWRRPAWPKRAGWDATSSSWTPRGAWRSTRRSWTKCAVSPTRSHRTTRSWSSTP